MANLKGMRSKHFLLKYFIKKTLWRKQKHEKRRYQI